MMGSKNLTTKPYKVVNYVFFAAEFLPQYIVKSSILITYIIVWSANFHNMQNTCCYRALTKLNNAGCNLITFYLSNH
jgi:hypothetical protein